MTWTSHATAIVKMAQQRLYGLRSSSLRPQILRGFYRGTIESPLTGCFTTWCGSKALERVVRTAQHITGCKLPSLPELYNQRCLRKPLRIIKDKSHPHSSLFSLLPSGRTYRMKKKLILDVDTGVDDAQAIMIALAAPDVDILGITCCSGNTPLENVLKNTLRVLKVCNRLDIPVYRGCAKPLLGRTKHAGGYHGKDGLGDVPDPDAPGLELVQKRKAVQAMIKIVKENPDEVTLVATAPLTNLAVAVQLDPSFPKKLKALYIMGGNKESRGNTTVCGEFNFVADSEAAYIVLDRYTCPTYIATWEFSCRNSLSWSFCESWLAQDTDKARFMEKITRHTREVAKSEEGQKELVAGDGFNSCDTYAVAAAIEDTLMTESEELAVTVELEGTYTRGMMVVDHLGLLKKTHKAFIMKKVDLEKFKKMLMASLK